MPDLNGIELEAAMAMAEAAHEIVLEADQRRAIATALTSQVMTGT